MINPVALLLRAATVAVLVLVGATLVSNITDALTAAVGSDAWNIGGRVHRTSRDTHAGCQARLGLSKSCLREFASEGR